MTKSKVFISYSHRDEQWKDQLLAHLRSLERLGNIEVWQTSDIPAGADWTSTIQDAAMSADIAILLISPDFLASDFIVQRELPTLLSQRKSTGLAVLPLVVRPSAWSAIPELAQLQFLNSDARPLSDSTSNEIDQTFAFVAERVSEISGALREREETIEIGQAAPFPSSRRQRQSSLPERFFISHSKVDGDFAELLQLRLERNSLAAWIDTDRLGPGIDWREGIDDAIREAPAVIAVMSPEAKQSEYVTYEWAFAWGCQKTIIPIMLRQTPLHPRIATLQFLDFSNRVARPWARLISTLQATAVPAPPISKRGRK